MIEMLFYLVYMFTGAQINIELQFFFAEILSWDSLMRELGTCWEGCLLTFNDKRDII